MSQVKITAYLQKGKFLIDKQGKNKTRYREKNMAKCILLLVIRSPHNIVPSNVPDNWEWTSEENQLHDQIV